MGLELVRRVVNVFNRSQRRAQFFFLLSLSLSLSPIVNIFSRCRRIEPALDDALNFSVSPHTLKKQAITSESKS